MKQMTVSVMLLFFYLYYTSFPNFNSTFNFNFPSSDPTTLPLHCI